MRLFIAIQFSEAIMRSLTEYQRELKRHGVTGNYTSVENLHLTLAFIGDYPDPDRVLDAMEQVPFTPFSLRLEGAGSFHDLLWTGIEKNEPLMSYVKRLRRSLAEQNIPYDRKKFSPHITLIRKARFQGNRPPSGADLSKWMGDIPLPAGRMKVRRISLMRSERGKHGMIYTEMGSISET